MGGARDPLPRAGLRHAADLPQATGGTGSGTGGTATAANGTAAAAQPAQTQAQAAPAPPHRRQARPPLRPRQRQLLRHCPWPARVRKPPMCCRPAPRRSAPRRNAAPSAERIPQGLPRAQDSGAQSHCVSRPAYCAPLSQGLGQACRDPALRHASDALCPGPQPQTQKG
jgi:hypothetical protein